ncbi:MAG: response regulator [Lachnospiraceae bacterium]|nr:response regulator [Lachnospiraceae bacterium]
MKNFHLTEIYAVIATAIMGSVFLIAGLDPGISILAFLLLFFVICAGYMVCIKHEYRRYTILYCVVFNFLCYPMFYFLTGDIYNGTPLYFAMGIILTFFLTTGKVLIGMVAAELLWYAFLLYFTYIYRDVLAAYRSYQIAGEGIAACFLLASVMPIFVIYYQTIIYKKTHEKIQQANRSLSSAGIGKSRFLANMSHEIRTPMNAIMGMIEVILKEDLSDEAREQAETIKNASSELLTIINNVLVYSKLNSNKMELLETRYNFRELIDEVVHTVVHEYADEETELLAYVDHTIPEYLYGDDIRIKQIFRYLLFSSLHQLSHGRISLEIGCIRTEPDHTVTLRGKISETGRGLTEAELSAVFGAYNEYDSRQRSDFKGMGLELFICRELLNLMEGSLKIESIAGIGMAIYFEFTNYILSEETIATVDKANEKCVLIYLEGKESDRYWTQLMDNFKISPYYVTTPNTFRLAMEERKYTHIFIPDAEYNNLKKTIDSAGCANYTYIVTDNTHVYEDFGKCRIIRKPVFCLNVADALNNTWKKEDYSKSSETQKIYYPDARVLVVDDNIVNLKVILNMLKEFGIHADMATSGEGCLNILAEEHYDLLLLDQLMPGMSGSETVYHLRKRGGINAAIPVVCITAEFGADIRERLIAEGFQDYIAKPIKEFYLNRVLQRLLPEQMRVLGEDGQPVEEPGKEEAPDPLALDTEAGIELVGGSKEVYHSILNTFYQEGLQKLVQVPAMLSDNIGNYTTLVHALKSSCASVGASNLSAMFKALEMAGKDEDREYIDRENDRTLSYFEQLLQKIREYLIANNALESAEEDFANAAEESLSSAVIEDLKQNLATVNLKYCEEKIVELTKTNYGEKNNQKLQEIRRKYEQFDYHAVRTLLDELLTMIKK